MTVRTTTSSTTGYPMFSDSEAKSWDSLRSWLMSEEILDSRLNPQFVVEVGSFTGNSTIHMRNVLKKNSLGSLPLFGDDRYWVSVRCDVKKLSYVKSIRINGRLSLLGRRSVCLSLSRSSRFGRHVSSACRMMVVVGSRFRSVAPDRRRTDRFNLQDFDHIVLIHEFTDRVRLNRFHRLLVIFFLVGELSEKRSTIVEMRV